MDLPLGLEGTVRAIQEWLETLVENILETTLVWPERLVVPIADPDAVTLPDGSTRTHEWYVENVLAAGRRVGVPRVVRAENVVGTDICRKPTRACAQGQGADVERDGCRQQQQRSGFRADAVHARGRPERAIAHGPSPGRRRRRAGRFRKPQPHRGDESVSRRIRARAARAKRAVDRVPANRGAQREKKSRPPMRVLCGDVRAFRSGREHDRFVEAAVGLVGVGMLTARVLRGVRLKGADNGGKSSDPFCKLAMRKANVEGVSTASSTKKDLIQHKRARAKRRWIGVDDASNSWACEGSSSWTCTTATRYVSAAPRRASGRSRCGPRGTSSRTRRLKSTRARTDGEDHGDSHVFAEGGVSRGGSRWSSPGSRSPLSREHTKKNARLEQIVDYVRHESYMVT